MKTVLLSQKIHPDGMKLLEGKVNILIPEKDGQEAFEELLPQADAVILRTNVHMTPEAVAKAGKLKIVARTGAGFDNVDTDALKAAGIILTNTPNANGISVVEHTVALALALVKRLPAYDKETREGNWKFRATQMSQELHGKTVGIIGLGRIGREVAEVFRKAFDMKVVAFDPFVKNDPVYEVSDDPVVVFSQADVVSIHCPSTKDTVGMVNKELLSKAKKGMIFINCARGDIVVEEDLMEALKDGTVAGAGLDTFCNEPVNRRNPFADFENVILTPHSAALTKEATARVQTQAAEQVLMYFDGKEPTQAVKL